MNFIHFAAIVHIIKPSPELPELVEKTRQIIGEVTRQMREEFPEN